VLLKLTVRKALHTTLQVVVVLWLVCHGSSRLDVSCLTCGAEQRSISQMRGARA
jgi:hypothetical protein